MPTISSHSFSHGLSPCNRPGASLDAALRRLASSLSCLRSGSCVKVRELMAYKHVNNSVGRTTARGLYNGNEHSLPGDVRRL